MQKQNANAPGEGSPFFDLLADAEEIKIREVPPEHKQSTANAILNFDDRDPSRTFLVRIKAKPQAPPAAPAAPEGAPVTPDNRTYLLKSAHLLLEDGDFILARNIYSYLLKVNIRDCEAMKGLGLCFSRLGDQTSAKKCFKALIELDGKEENLLWLGQSYIAEGNDAVALEHFRRITTPGTLPKSAQFDLFKEMGNCETRVGRFDDAWSYYHRALELQPASDTIHVNLGTLELQREHVDIAHSYFRMAITLNPQSSRAYCGMGLVALAKHDDAQAKKEFEKALDLDKQNVVALFQLAALAAHGNSESAKYRLEEFLKVEPKNAEARYALAVLHFRENQWAICAKEVETILSIEPHHARAKSLREQLASNRHRPE